MGITGSMFGPSVSAPRHRRHSGWFAAAAVAGLAISSSVVSMQVFAEDGPAPTIEADQADYPPGATVTLTGYNWQPGESVDIDVIASGASWGHNSDPDPVADGSGVVTYQFAIAPFFIPSYDVIASGTVSGTATTSFTDASVASYDQCSNDDGDGYASGDIGCRWTNGNLQSNNSTYFEGDATVQRLWLDSFLPGSVHSITLEYGTTKAGKHTYDYLTNWDFSEDWITDADLCQDIDANANQAGGSCTLWGPDNTIAIPDDPNTAFGEEVPPVPQPPGRVFTMRNGTMTAVTPPAVASGTYAGDSETQLTITFTVGNDPDACVVKSGVTTCSVVLWFGTHIARSDQWASGGATTVSGSPYHVQLKAQDGESIGNRDNQMQAGAIRPAATLTLIKTVINDDGGTAVADDWTLTAAGPTGFSGQTGVSSTVEPGLYDLSEIGPAGYSASAWSCTAGQVDGDTVSVAAGENITCTITNDDIAPTLKLVKTVTNNDGGTAVANDWTLSATAAAPKDGRNFSNAGGSGVFQTVLANAGYELAESTVAGYTAGSWSCDGGTLVGSTITLAAGQTGVTCTINNDDVAPTLKLVKTVTNDDGGTAVANDWTLSATAAAPKDGRNFSNAGGSGVFQTVLANAGYELAESTVAGYTAGSWSCDGGTLVGSTITLAAGQTGVTCTINNDDVAPTLKLVKTVTNDDGGTAVANDWTLSATAAAPKDGRNFSNAGGSGVFQTVLANAGYELAESTVAGYTAGSWSCDGGTLVGSTITLAAGQTGVTCTINNDDVAPTLKLVKTVTNNDGGAAGPNDWTLSATAAAPKDGRNFSNAGGSGVFQTVLANAGYELAESTVAGYTAGSWSCDGGTLVGSTITLAAGQTGVTCTINNDDVAPTLKLVKTVTNDDGGTAVANDWTLSATAAAPKDGRNFSNAGGSGVFQTVLANAGYELAESTVAGYTAGSWSCDGGTLVGSTITLAAGQTGVTCTINNDDVAPTLKLVKTVTNDDGGAAGPNDWTLSATAAAPKDGRNFSNAGGSGVFQTVLANAGYELAESTVAGYTAGSWSCDGGTLVGSTITLAAGQTGVTCTINNDDVAPTLKLVKTVTNDDGGAAGPNDWTLSATAAAPKDGRNFSNAGGSGVFQTVLANAGYELAESTVAGYTAGSWSCDGGTLVGSTITLAAGQTGVTCTINNDDVAPTLKLVKTVDNGANPGGTAVADDWSLSATAAAPKDGRNFSNAGGSGVFQTVLANAGYDLSEVGPAGYQIKTDWSCDGGTQVGDTVTLGLDEDVTCTIENEALGMTELLKLTNGAPSDSMVWNFSLKGPNVDESDSSPPTTVDFGGAKLIPGEVYTICETGIPAGWTLEWQVDTDGDGVPDTIIPHVMAVNNDPVDPVTGYSRVYDPNYVAPPGTYTNDTRCVNFVVDVGETLAFQIDNQFPGGDPRTIGFWKNWNTCTGGNQPTTAASNGGPAAGWFILDDLLNDPGFTIGLLHLDGTDCEDAVSILDKRDIANGKKNASDAAYGLAAQLLAAQLNLSAGAETCQAVVDAVNAGQALLASSNFDGSGTYFKGKTGGALRAQATSLAGILDEYNNGLLCSP